MVKKVAFMLQTPELCRSVTYFYSIGNKMDFFRGGENSSIMSYRQASINVAFGKIGGNVRVLAFWTNAWCTRICRFVHKAKKLKFSHK